MNKIVLPGILLAVLFLSISCSKDPQPLGVIPDDSEKSYKLVWKDEFNGSTLDTSKWTYETGNNGGWGNNELEYYTDRTNNLYVRDGKLVIRALQEDYSGFSYTSARIKTHNKGDWKYGKIEARIKMPYSQGIWSAFWMMPTQSVYGGWPFSGEIDIVELMGHEPNKVYGTVHFENNGHKYTGGDYTLNSGWFKDKYHIFSIEWDKDYIKWYVDGNQYFSFSKSGDIAGRKPFDEKSYIILNMAVGGNWPGFPDGTTVFPQYLYIDWLRVYQEK